VDALSLLASGRREPPARTRLDIEFTPIFMTAPASAAIWYGRCNSSGDGLLEAVMKRCIMMNQHARTLLSGAGNTARALRALRGAVLGTLVLGAAGCYARAGTGAAVVYSEPIYDEPVVVVQTVPAEIESYPRHRYGDSYVYLMDGRWYARSRGRWVVYRAEPRELATVRVSYEAKYGRHYRPRNEAASPPRPRHHHDRP
jgi:hypothetical protein